MTKSSTWTAPAKKPGIQKTSWIATVIFRNVRGRPTMTRRRWMMNALHGPSPFFDFAHGNRWDRSLFFLFTLPRRAVLADKVKPSEVRMYDQSLVGGYDRRIIAVLGWLHLLNPYFHTG